MKKTVSAALLLMLCLLCAGALANGWGLPGGLVTLVDGDPMYENYTMDACDAGTVKNRPGSIGDLAVFVMEHRSHTELFIARQEEGAWKAEAQSATAVRRLYEEGAQELTISVLDGSTFELIYPDALYRYTYDGHAWLLVYAELESGAATLALRDGGYGYAFARGDETATWWTTALAISRFEDTNDYRAVSISALPATAEQVLRLNHTQSLLPNGMYFGVTVTAPGKGTAPVYSAPDETAMRFGNGKAAVGLAGTLSVLDWRDGYMMIHYRVGQDAARIGYIREDAGVAKALEKRGFSQQDFDGGVKRWGRMPAVIAEETVLTDDPHVSEGARNVLTAGTEVTCIAFWGPLYALVEYTAPAGQLARGFVPMKAIAIPEPEIAPEAMAKIENTAWEIWAGGSMYCDYQNYREDGLFIGEWQEDEAGESNDAVIAQYAISEYAPAWSLYWADTAYMVTFTRENGHISRYGLDFGDEGINLKTDEGGGGFRPYTGELAAADALAAQLKRTDRSAQPTPEPPMAATPEPAAAQSASPQLGRVVQTGARDAEEGLGEAVVAFSDEPPASLAAALAECGVDASQVTQGYAQRRGRWEYAQMLLADGEKQTLCCGLYVPGAGWQLTFSDAALRQGEAAQLHAIAESCYAFDVIYPDVTYSWFCGSNGWQLNAVYTAEYKLSAGYDYIRWYDRKDAESPLQSSAVYSSQPILLTEFDVAAYPTTPEEARAQSEGHPENDPSKALMILTDEQKTWMISDTPCAALREYASSNAPAVAYLMDGTEAEALEVSQDGDFVHIRIGDLEGWAERGNVLLGAERAGEFISGGEIAQVYAAGSAPGQPLLAKPNAAAEQKGFLAYGESVHVLAILPDDLWFYVRAQDGQMGYMSYHTVAQTDNMHDAYIYSEDPARRLNLRAFPETDAQVLGKYYSGVRVVHLFSLRQPDGWSRVIIEGVTGWVRGEYLTYWNDYNGREWLPPIGTVQGVNSKGLNVRTGPDGDVLTAYPVGTKMEILGVTQNGNWAHVRLRDGTTGYAMTRYLGGEPERAAKNSFALKESITENAVYGGEVTGLSKGERVRIAERPHAAWHTPGWREGDYTRVYGEEAAIYVVGDGAGAFTTADNLALDW